MKLSARDKILMLIIYSLSIIGLTTLYHARRIAAMQKVKTGLNSVQREISAINKALSAAEQRKQGPGPGADTLAYIEALYRTADENRLKFHEVITDNSQNPSTARNDKNAAFSSSRLKITVKGDFRSVAEYVRTILNQHQLSRITELKITADQTSVVGNINIELFTLR